MKTIKAINQIQWPNENLEENFKFSVVHPDGVFTFLFRYFNDRWNCWCTLPSGEIRGVGVEPNVMSWSGFLDYGVYFMTDLEVIDKSSLPLTQLYIVSW